MKSFMILLFMSILVDAVPSYIEKELCSKLSYSNIHCGEGSEISVYRELLLEDNRTLKVLFLDSNNLEDMEFITTFPKAYVMVDKTGKWHILKNSGTQRGYISDIIEDFKKQLWVQGSVGVESPSPFLLYSENGEKFLELALPFEKNIGAYEYTIKSLCFQENYLLLDMSNDGKKKLWRMDYSSISSKNPQWKRTFSTSKKCIPPKNSLEIQSKKRNKNFVENQDDHYFTIQLGAFKKMKNLNIVKDKISHLNGYFSLHWVKDKEYIRLLSKYLRTKKKAQIILKNLKRTHPHNKYIQQAFVQKIKNEY